MPQHLGGRACALGLLVCLAAGCGGGPTTQPTPLPASPPPAPTPPPPSPPPRAELSGAWRGRVTNEANTHRGTMRLEWTLGGTPVLDGAWSWAMPVQSLDAAGTVRALELGDSVVAVFTLTTPIRCATGESIPLFSAIVRLVEGRLVGTIGGGGACELRLFELLKEAP